MEPFHVRERMAAGYTGRIGSKIQYFGPNRQLLSDDPSGKQYHSIENLILHSFAMLKDASHVQKRLSAGYTGTIFPKSQYFRQNTQFFSDDLLESITIR
jgi:hypothetical protein